MAINVQVDGETYAGWDDPTITISIKITGTEILELAKMLGRFHDFTEEAKSNGRL